MKIRWAMMVSPSQIRRENALKVKAQIPELELHYIDGKEIDLFVSHLHIMNTDSDLYDGVVMMEDDVILCRDFVRKATDVIDTHRNDVVQFFERALAKKPLKGGWQPGGQFFSCVCYYMPAQFTRIFQLERNLKEFKEDYFPKKHEPWGYPIDTYIAFVLGKSRMIYWRELPYLVQHSDFKSMLGNRSTKRQSKYFIDDILERKHESE